MADSSSRRNRFRRDDNLPSVESILNSPSTAPRPQTLEAAIISRQHTPMRNTTPGLAITSDEVITPERAITPRTAQEAGTATGPSTESGPHAATIVVALADGAEGWKCCHCFTVVGLENGAACYNCPHLACKACALCLRKVIGWTCCLCHRLNATGERVCGNCGSPKNPKCCEDVLDWVVESAPQVGEGQAF